MVTDAEIQKIIDQNEPGLTELFSAYEAADRAYTTAAEATTPYVPEVQPYTTNNTHA